MSPIQYQSRRSEGKPFRLVKYFAVASFVVIIIFSFPFTVFVSQGAKEILLKNVEDYAIVVGENMNNLVDLYFTQRVIYSWNEAIELGNKDQQKLMDDTVKFAIRGLDVELVNLYSIDQGIVIYSTDPELIKTKVIETPEYKNALNGEQSTIFISEGKGLWGLWKERIGGKKRIRTYIPMTIFYEPTGEELVTGIFELIIDVTNQYKSIVKLQNLIFGLSILIMTLIFFALLLIVHRAEKIIARRAIEQRELEEQLYLAERLAALGEMVAGVSHEIKNPLGIIQSTSELLASMPNADETQKRLSKVITEESVRLNRIVTEFLDFARPHKLNLNECHLEDVIRKNINFLKPELENKGIVVYDNLDGRSFKLQADGDLLYRALMNIFINAIQAIDNAGSIAVNMEEEKGGYRVVVEDTGCGIAKENMNKIFNPFFTTKEKGSGLGLPIVRKIVEGHGGSIEVDSIEGSGTKISIYLPRKM